MFALPRHGRRRRLAPHRPPGGFVLVGVVMFVLALTILGLSLFGLSSYEAQFIGGSVREARAFHAAAGGIERAKFALVATDLLESARADLPPQVVYAVAVQERPGGPDSAGTVLWDGSPLTVRVLAAVEDARCMLEARFHPAKPDNYYKRLLTVRDGVIVRLAGSADTDPGIRNTQTYLVGDAWQEVDDVAWNGDAQIPWDREVTIRPVPVPAVADFIAAHAPGAMTPVEGPDGYFDLRGGIGEVRTYWSPGNDPDNDHFSVHTPPAVATPVIDVTGAGAVVWMAEHGFRFDHKTEVHGTADDCLILVSPRNGRDRFSPEVGPWFFGGLESPVVPVILVSDDQVRIEHFNNYRESSQTSYLSIFARSAFFMGPSGSYFPEPTMTLAHVAGSVHDVPGGLIDRLCELGALPNCSATVAAAFPTVKGAWRELNPDSPPDLP